MIRRRIYLVRHGDVDYFSPDGKPLVFQEARLNSRGEAEADALGKFLNGCSIQKVIVSPLIRAKETAARILQGSKSAIIDEPCFREIEPASLQSTHTVSPEQLKQALLGCLGPGLKPDTPFLGGETFGPFLTRVNEGWRRLIDGPPFEHAMIVAHSVVNRALLSLVLGLGLEGLQSIEQDSGCVNVIDFVGCQPILRLVNHTPLDPMKLGKRVTSLEELAEKAIHASTNKKNNSR